MRTYRERNLRLNWLNNGWNEGIATRSVNFGGGSAIRAQRGMYKKSSNAETDDDFLYHRSRVMTSLPHACGSWSGYPGTCYPRYLSSNAPLKFAPASFPYLISGA